MVSHTRNVEFDEQETKQLTLGEECTQHTVILGPLDHEEPQYESDNRELNDETPVPPLRRSN